MSFLNATLRSSVASHVKLRAVPFSWRALRHGGLRKPQSPKRSHSATRKCALVGLIDDRDHVTPREEGQCGRMKPLLLLVPLI
eukprot:6246907-Amphidinium_carterae.2